MTALSAATARQSRGVGYVVTVPLNAASQVYKGGLVIIDTDGFGRPGVDTAGFTCAGVALEDALGGASDGDESVEVRFGCEFLFTASSVTQAMLGDPMYLVDDNTVDDAAGATNDVFVGIMTEYVSATSCWVFVPGPVAYPTSGVTASAAELNKLDESAAAGCGFLYASGTLTSTELLALMATPITAIPAPGAGRAIIPLMVSLFHDHGGTDYVQAAGSDHLALRYSGGVEIDEIGSEAQCTALIEASADAALAWPIGGIGWVPTENEAVQFDNNGTAEYTTGNGVLDWYIVYAIVPVA